MNIQYGILLYVISINITSFLLFTVDKYKAVHHLWRISEFTLLLISFLGGGFGSFLAMKVCHHKTRHLQFRLLIPLFMVLQIIGGIVFFCSY